jgi:hypothetical protein
MSAGMLSIIMLSVILLMVVMHYTEGPGALVPGKPFLPICGIYQ